MNAKVSVVIPVWNGRELLARLLARLCQQTYPIADTIVVDNGSEDGSAEYAQSHGARVLRMGTNAGFSRAVNRGIGQSSAPLVALVNTDVVPQPDWLEQLVRAMDDPDVWFATGKLLLEDDPSRIDGTFDALCRGGCPWRVGSGRPDGPEFSRACPIALASATATLYRREIFDRLGPFDDSFESYLEDVDFSLRCACQGLSGVYVPEAVATHRGSATLGRWHPRVVRLTSRNQVLLVAKHYAPGFRSRYAWPVLVAQSLWGLVALRHGAAWPWFRGKLEALRHIGLLRRQWPPPACCGDRLANILQESERRIWETQRRTGFDWYWKAYFFLTAGRFDS